MKKYLLCFLFTILFKIGFNQAVPQNLSYNYTIDKEQSVNEFSTRLGRDDFENGIYIVQIKTRNNFYTQKQVVQK
jgi:hypothetical protein